MNSKDFCRLIEIPGVSGYEKRLPEVSKYLKTTVTMCA